MFNEKNFPKLIIITPIFSVFLISFFTIYFFIKNQYAYFEEESIRVEKDYITKQKNILKKEVNSVINYIDFTYNNASKKPNFKIEETMQDIIKYIESIRYENNGYIWIHNINYYLIAHPFRQKDIGKFDIDLKDAKGKFITRKFIDLTKDNPSGIYLEYNWQKPNQIDFSKKLGFLRRYNNFGWVVGAGLYMDDIQKSIQENKKILEEKIKKYIKTVIFISIIVILAITLLSLIISNKINQAFKDYKQNVKKKENELSELNKNLEIKVEEAINAVQKKDKAMLHQSRLARMGSMLNLIAHQWRQPLSEISGILMELETASKFNKADKALIKDCIDESNNLIGYMSNTIDDFRNFFKPDKKKVHFYIDDACNEAISLVSASIKSSNISLFKKVKCNSIIYGYEREFAQVMLNLISNAKDVLNQRNTKNPNIYIELDYNKNSAFIIVKDNAGGVEEEHLDLIFEPYFTTKSASKGTGLGLYMAKMIIEKNMNGEINVFNDKDGAVFTVNVPINS